MEVALAENQNPPLEVNSSNFFNIRFFKRIQELDQMHLTTRQRELFFLLKEKKIINKREAALFLNVSEDTALRELNALISMGLIHKSGSGRATAYTVL